MQLPTMGGVINPHQAQPKRTAILVSTCLYDHTLESIRSVFIEKLLLLSLRASASPIEAKSIANKLI